MQVVPNIILASSSPRRKELLTKAGVDFKVLKVDFKEEINSSFFIEQIPIILSKDKMNQCPKPKKKQILITCDTIVTINNRVLEKPKNDSEAFEMISSLSNNMHKVISGVTLSSNSSLVSFNSITEVLFSEIPKEEILKYIDTRSPFDKAGAYGIQDDFGLRFVKRINGCYQNVIGLPVNQLLFNLKLI